MIKNKTINVKYRTDIDGLRAIAVLSVIFFHINEDWIPGGFLGVDVFFVISGYLITLILLKEIDATGTISIICFYKRRIKRIIPALFFVLFFTLLAGFFLFAPDDLFVLAKSMIWSLFSAANIFFFLSVDTGYFSKGSDEFPLLHLWSLGVEEQFYIIWPFIILFLLNFINSIKKRLLIISSFFVGSLILAQLTIVSDHSFSYYMLFTRAWELFGGVIVALVVHSGFKSKRIINEFMALIGLFVIILSFIFVTKLDPVPGVAVLPVIIGTSLLILSGVTDDKTYIGQLLSFRLLVAIGLVSYSAYLWHWPILAYMRYVFIEIDYTITLIILFVTLFMAITSYYIIEKPLRKRKLNDKAVFLWYFIIPVTIFTVVLIIVVQGIKYKKDFIFPWHKLNKVEANTLPVSTYAYNCQYSFFDVKAFSEKRCVYPDNIAKANAILIGDSNAAHYLGMLIEFSKNYKFSIRNATQSSCPMIFDGEFSWIYPKYKEGCSIYRHSIFKEVIKYDTVIIGGNWPDYYHKENFKVSFEATIDKLSKNVKHIIILGKVPTFPNYNNECEVRAIKNSYLKCSLLYNNKRRDIYSNQYLRKIAKKYNNVKYFDIQNQICSSTECSPYVSGSSVYYNHGHLSLIGSKRIGLKMIEENDRMLKIFESLRGKEQIYQTFISSHSSNLFITFTVEPQFKNVQVAFYVYREGKKIDTQWYSDKLSYKLSKKKFGKGRYRVRYFIVNNKIKDPGKYKNKEIGFSEFVQID
ncbi:acyltransferase family protein [Candidatus Venteria ishoeyi]|uniref:O-acetyltransferase OatA n=1 Tax=Candidatus Venteria ishoeyi TaxID=1899563 RepID=A0A1H6FBD1_9GAMM|nr:acyltransferase family protein [Candidatus Venteria ishoeyi]SEH06305.1 O-acetyltransferase OatA [Candidatus Venteria ishoeyi]